MFSKTHPIILFVDRFGFSIYQDTLTNIPKFNFTPDIVANLDVVSKDQFVSLIATFIQINKIVPSNLEIILSDTIIYVKNLLNPQPGSEQNQKDIQNYLDNVPFEEVIAKVITIGQKNALVVVNKDLIITIASAFVNKGSVVEAIIPGFLFGSRANFALGLTQENVRIILNGSEILRSGNLLMGQQKTTSPEVFTERKELANEEKKPQKLRQYVLIGIFVVLLVILAVVYLTLGVSQTSPVKKMKKPASAVIAPTVSPASRSALVQTAITTAPPDIENVKIKIINSSQSSATVNAFKNQLIRVGFESVVIEDQEKNVAEKSSVLFSQDVSVDVRDIVVTEIKKILPDVSILESQDSDLTITILIGKLNTSP